jgi:N-acetylglucosamine-6-phosphate deacetylase
MLLNANKEFGISLTDAWTMASLTPASIIGIDSKKGSLAVGKDADILILDRELNIKRIYIKGRLYKKQED